MLKKSNFNELWNQFDSNNDYLFHSMIEMRALAEIVWRFRVSDWITLSLSFFLFQLVSCRIDYLFFCSSESYNLSCVRFNRVWVYFKCNPMVHLSMSFPNGGEGGRAYPGAIDIFQNKLSIIPTVGWNSHIKCPYRQDGIETFSVWNVCMPLLNCWCLISCFSLWQLSRSGEETSAVLHIHQEKT